MESNGQIGVLDILRNSVSKEFRHELAGLQDYTDKVGREHLFSIIRLEELKAEEKLLIEVEEALNLCNSKNCQYFRLIDL